jgi:hypothetical protein
MSAALTLALVALTATAAPSPAIEPVDIITRWVRGSAYERPRINVWLSRDEIYHRGDRARVYFKSDQDAYVTIVRIDTDGRVRILFPIDPWEDNWARGGRTFEVLGRDRDEAFRVDDYPGVGYVFAIASVDPFEYQDIIRGDHWDYRAISDGRVRGDPYIAVSDLADRIAREGEYDYDVTEYSVERHYDYPRFVCYDCHTYASWRYWDPYSAYCSRFRIVIYNDWYYYPYRRYRGTVIVRPYRPGPRYVFKDHDPRNDYITRVATRPRNDRGTQRPATERDRTSADVGGRGAVPTPVSPRRQVPETGKSTGGEVRRRPEPRQPVNTEPDARDSRPEPRRGTDPDRTRDPGTRDRPSPSTEEGPRRRPSADRAVEPSGQRPDRREEPRVREPRREPSREPVRQAPAERSRGEPSAKSPPSRSSGEPELKRRRPS